MESQQPDIPETVYYTLKRTTWMQEMVTLINSQGDPTLSRSVPNWARAPWLEQYYCPEVLSSMQEPRTLTTHMPYSALAPALKDSKAKVIYIGRNPRDVAVSSYHFCHFAKFMPTPASFQEYLNHFLQGKVHFGSWFDHVKSWTDAKEDIQNFFFITYEEMKQDLRGSIKRVSSFLQRPLVDSEITASEQQCSFATMKNNPMVNYTLVPEEIMSHNSGKFMRKGASGDWRNTFTVNQSLVFDAVYEAQMQYSPLRTLWPNATDLQVATKCPVTAASASSSTCHVVGHQDLMGCS
ncbi:sulfotransferase family 5A, member 1 isoform X2 [Engraulis encrasicolus]|uniref:sulfotransferase family 5A, member 1 isoform X2 n=1 Tax=Engraulis encrasicolus TaxID=184585 RepID=UPI002FCEDF39